MARGDSIPAPLVANITTALAALTHGIQANMVRYVYMYYIVYTIYYTVSYIKLELYICIAYAYFTDIYTWCIYNISYNHHNYDLFTYLYNLTNMLESAPICRYQACQHPYTLVTYA